MTFYHERFYLQVRQVEKICLFELSMKLGQRISVEIEYPKIITEVYEKWRRAYLEFYQTRNMRGRLAESGKHRQPNDWYMQVVQAEAQLIYEFQNWLRGRELYEICTTIAENLGSSNTAQVFLNCASTLLARLPWETWDIGGEYFNGAKAIQIIRTSLNIRGKIPVQKQAPRKRTRVLAISGDNTGLDFHQERQILKSASRILDVHFIVKPCSQQINDVLIDEKGWDMLFFMGHSNEAPMIGGEIGIAPGVSIPMKEISSQLSIARDRGLKVAIFNSCEGLHIAEYLINLGLSQVVVMREAIQNEVAEEFLVHFCKGLTNDLDVYESVTEAKQFLRLEKSYTYPSSYLVPSVFCHPEAELFRIPPNRNIIQRNWRLIKPTVLESVALAASVFFITMIPIQDFLIDQRVFTQAVYRKVTKQYSKSEVPPVALVEIDTESIVKRKLPSSQLLPVNRSYLAQLMERVRKLNASVIGLDFVLDTPQKDPPTADKDLGTAVARAVNENKWVIFGTVLNGEGKEVSVNDANGIRNRNWTLQGYTESHLNYVELPANCRDACPFSYLMAITQLATQEITDLPKPSNSGDIDLRSQLLDAIDKNLPQKENLTALKEWRPFFGIYPIIDFSIPPNQAYTKIPAWRLMENKYTDKLSLSKQVVIIAAGSDERLGRALGRPDRSPSPSAIKYWTEQTWLTGGESLAYMTHHYLRRRFVTPIPSIWMFGLAVIIGKVAVIVLSQKSWSQSKLQQISNSALLSVGIYGLVGLQLYISAGILFPWLVPSSVFLAYVLPAVNKKRVS